MSWLSTVNTSDSEVLILEDKPHQRPAIKLDRDFSSGRRWRATHSDMLAVGVLGVKLCFPSPARDLSWQNPMREN